MKSLENDAMTTVLVRDLYWFVRQAFADVHPGTTFQKNWHIRAVCYALTECCFGEQRKLIVTLPPRSLKSFCISSALPAFLLGHDPALRIICASYGEDLANAHTRTFRVIIHSPWYKKVFPGTVISGIKDTETETITTMGGGRLGLPMGGSFTGQGGDLIIVDDPIKAQDCYSEAERERCHRIFVETLSTRMNNPAKGRMIVTMQRLHEDDLVGRLLAQDGWTVLNIPAIAEQAQAYRIGSGGNDFHNVQPGDLMDLVRLPLKYLDQQRLIMGTGAFSAQFLQDPIPADGEMIKREWVRRFRGDPDPQNYEQVVQTWDTAIKTGVNHDYSACITLGIRSGEVHVLDAVQRKVPLHSMQIFAAEHAIKWNANTVLIEDVSLGTELARNLRQSIGAAIIPIVPKGPKVARVFMAAAHIEAGRLFLPNKALPWLEMLERQLFTFPNAKNDDLVDALSQALIWYGHGGTPRLNTKVTLIGENDIKIAQRSTYYDRMGGSFPL